MHGQRWMEGWDYNVVPRDPSKLTAGDVKKLLKCWKERTKADEEALMFRQGDPKDMREKFGMTRKERREMKRRKEAWMDLTDEEEENESRGGERKRIEMSRKDEGRGKMMATVVGGEGQNTEGERSGKRKRVEGEAESPRKKQRRVGGEDKDNGEGSLSG